MDPILQKDLIGSLQDEEVAAAFADLEPDDRVALLEEVPASVASRLMRGLPDQQRGAIAGCLASGVGDRRGTHSAGPSSSCRHPVTQPSPRINSAQIR